MLKRRERFFPTDSFLLCCEQIQESFAQCALDVKSVFDSAGRAKPRLEWSNSSLSYITTLLLRAHKKQEAW